MRSNTVLPGLAIVPGGSDGPSGVLVCCENYILYKNLQDQPDIRCPIPQRQNDLDDAERSMLIVCSSMHKTKVSKQCFIPSAVAMSNSFLLLSRLLSYPQHMFFFLLQTEQGDIFKVTLDTDDDLVSNIDNVFLAVHFKRHLFVAGYQNTHQIF